MVNAPGHRLITLRVAFASFVLFLPPSAFADATGTLVTLSPEQVEAAKEAGAARHARDAAARVQAAPRDHAIHGEVGVSIGTGGYNEVFGTAIAPLGDNGLLALSIEKTQYGSRLGRGHWARR